MPYVNCGVWYAGDRIRTKKQLKELLVDDPELVIFDHTSMFDGCPAMPVVNGRVTDAVSIPDAVVMTVVGPDPYTDRKWYASVWQVNGKIKIS